MIKTAVFPGSFDPVTKGHQDIVLRATELFDKIIIAVGRNATKKYMFPLEQRIQWLTQVFSGVDTVEIQAYDSLTVDFCIQVNAQYLLRGIRSVTDFEYERTISQMNASMHHPIETIFLITSPEYSGINSTVVREIIKYGGDASVFLPKEIKL